MAATLPVQVDGELRLPGDELPRALREKLLGLLTFPNPERIRAERAGRPCHGMPKFIEGWAVEDGFGGSELLLPRGMLPALVELARREGFDLEVALGTTNGQPLPPTELRQPLRDYQQAAVAALLDGRNGLVEAPCGAGKTQIGVGALVALGRTTLILVHTKDLLQQWVDRIAAVTGIEAGVIGGGKNRPAAVTVAMVQTLAGWTAHELRCFGRDFGTLIVDEAHHGPCQTYWSLVPAFPARNRFGLTATPERDDGLTPMLGWMFGPTLYRIDQATLIQAGHLVVPELVEVRTETRWQGDPKRHYHKLLDVLAHDADRNQAIVDLVSGEVRQGGSVLVLSQRKDHCALLAELLEQRGIACQSLTSDVGKVRRKKTLADMRTGASSVLIATQLADEGLDIPRLSALVLAMPQRAAGKTIQRLGRIMRPAAGKRTPRLYDLVDVEIGVLQSQAASRRRAYRQVLGGSVSPRVISLRHLRLEVA